MHTLTRKQVKLIRKLYGDGGQGHTMRSLGMQFGVTRTTIWDIVHRHNWKDVK